MKFMIIAAVLQASTPAAAPPAPTEQPAAQSVTPDPDTMSCVYDRQTRSRLCTTAEGEELRCRRERVMGSRMPVMRCTTAREDELMERESRDAIDRQQRITTPDRG